LKLKQRHLDLNFSSNFSSIPHGHSAAKLG